MRASFSLRFPVFQRVLVPLLSALVGMVVVTAGAAADPLPGGDSRFQVAGEVTPSPAPLGAELSFRVAVTNVSDSTASFVVDGCPVHYALDGVFTPSWPCLEFARLITLKPGESVTFDPQNAPYMTHDPHLYPPGPGGHFAVLEVRSVGADTVDFTVGPPAPDIAYLAGRVVRSSGMPVEGGQAYLTPASPEDSTGAPGGNALAAPVTQQGWFWFDAVPPGVYFLHAEVGNRIVWYGGENDPAQPTPLVLEAGTFRDDVELVLGGPGPPPPPPPPPNEFFLSGLVRELTADSVAIPLGQAAVLAVPVAFQGTDSLPPPLDAGRTGAAEGEPSLPLLPGCYLDLTGPDGRFTIQVPPGLYRLLAGRLASHRYQYWSHADRLADARIIQVPDPTMQPQVEPRFDLVLLDGLPLGMVEGTVLAADPVESTPVHPVEGATVIAHPLLPSPVADPAPHRVTTGADGAYAMELPADTPYLVSVEAEGYETRFYRDAFHPEAAEWVDVAPGETVAGVDFILRPGGPHPGDATIVGSVFRVDSLFDCGPGQDCAVPAAGAIVRVTAAFPTFAPYEVRARVDEEGRFRVDGLVAAPDGSLAYYVSAEMAGYERAYYPGGVPFVEAVPLSVFPGDVTDAGRIVLGIQIPPPPSAGFLDGRITADDGRPLEGAWVRAFLDPGHPEGRVVSATTGADGWFHMRGFPAGSMVILAAEAEGFVPAYFPNAHRWREAEPVPVGGMAAFVEPVAMTLYPAVSGGPYLQAGRVRIAPEEAGDDTLFTAPLGPRARIMAWHRQNLPGAFFYVVNALSMAPVAPVMAGASTGDNGTVVLTGLPEGVYAAYADRPGYETAWFADENGAARNLFLNPHTPAVLADIRMEPLGSDLEPREAGAAQVVHGLSNAPNPFRPSTVIQFDLVESCPVTLQVFDYRGRLVRRLLADVFRNAGPNEVSWDATDDNGRRVSPGVYFYRVDAQQESVARKLVVLP